MLHLRRRVALGVDVAHFLQLERTLERHRELVAATEVQKVLRIDVVGSEIADFIVELENLLDLTRQFLQGLDDLAALYNRHMASARHEEREERKRDELAGECIARIGGEVLDELINRKVIELECTRLGITVTDAEVKQEVVRLCKETGMEASTWYQILKTRHNITPEQYHRNRIWPAMAMKKLVGASVTVSEQDLKTAYEHHFGARVKVRLIVYGNIRRANEAWNTLQKSPEEF